MKEKKFDYRDYISKNKFTLGKVSKTSNFENSVFENGTKPLRTVLSENNTYKGKDIWPDDLDTSDFGSKITDIRQLKKGNMYILLEYGMDEWHGDYKLVKTGPTYLFKDTSGVGGKGGNDLKYTVKEITELINDDGVYTQK